MHESPTWIAGAAVLAGAALIARLGLRKLKAVIGQFYRRLDAIALEAGAVRHEAATARQEVAALRQDLAAMQQDVAAAHQDIAAIRHQSPAIDHALREEVGRLLIATRTTAVLARSNVAAHLDALRADAPGPVTLSYAFSRIVRSVAPIVTRRNASRTAVCSLALGDAYRAKVQPALVSHDMLAERHGFSHAVLTEWPVLDSRRPPSWMKLPLVMNLFEQGFDRVLYLDADALVTNDDVDIDAIFGERTPSGSLRVAEDEGGINNGVMFLQDGPAIRRLLDLTWLFDADVTHGTWEQNALKTLMEMSEDVARHVTLEEDPRRFNSFAVERARFYATMDRIRWRPGDFVCHFSGIRSPDLEQLIAHYATEVAPLRRAGASMARAE